MARFSTLFTALVSAATIQGALASPLCAKYRGNISKDVWGWPGRLLGSDRWGPVVVSVEAATGAIETYIAQACGSSIPSTAQPSATGSPAVPSSVSRAAVPTTVAPEVVISSSASPSSSASTIGSISTAPASVSPSNDLVRPTTTSVSSRPPAPTTRVVTSVRPTTTATPSPRPTITAAPRPVTTTTRAPAPTTAAPSTGGSSGTTSATDIADYLAGHNTIRRNHGAADLTWSDELAAAAQKWANNCQWKHSGGAVGPYGENLAAGTNLGIRAAIKMWTDEVSEYDPSNPQFSHFTQVVWKATTQVGCAVQTCNGIIGSGSAKFYVCEYNPAGNVLGRFGQNVQV